MDQFVIYGQKASRSARLEELSMKVLARCFRSSGAPESRRPDDALLILTHQRAAAGRTGGA